MGNVSFEEVGREVGVDAQGVIEPTVDFAERILTAIDWMSDEEWEKLSRETQNWYNRFGEKPTT